MSTAVAEAQMAVEGDQGPQSLRTPAISIVVVLMPLSQGEQPVARSPKGKAASWAAKSLEHAIWELSTYFHPSSLFYLRKK